MDVIRQISSAIRESQAGLFVRRHISTWPGYQQLPDTDFFHGIKMRLRAGASLFSATIRESSEIRTRRQAIESLRGKYKGDVLILGNGPSVNNLSLAQIMRFQNNGGQILVMNGFLYSELSKKILPDFYFVIDPDYWDSKSVEGSKLRSAIQDYLENFNPNCLLFQTSTTELLCPKHGNTLFVDGRSIAGLKRWMEPNKPWGLPSSVALAAISTMKYFGFTNIYYAGLDSSSYLNFFVDDLSQVKYTSANTYFFSQTDDDPFNASKAQGMGDWPLRHMADVFYAAAIFLRDFKDLSDGKCINVGNDRTNDASPRACLLG